MGDSGLQVGVKGKMSTSSEMTNVTCLVDSNKQYNRITTFLTNGMINA